MVPFDQDGESLTFAGPCPALHGWRGLQCRDASRVLKGSGGGHGYPMLSQNASELEQQVLQGATGEIARGLDELAGLVARIKVLP